MTLPWGWIHAIGGSSSQNPASPCTEAAIDYQTMTGHVTGGVGGEINERTDHFIRLGHSRERDAGGIARLENVVLPALHATWNKGIDPDTRIAPIRREVAGQSDYCGL